VTRAGLRERLRDSIKQAMRERDRPALAAYRTALAALDNAEAAELTDEHRAGALEAAGGLGTAEVERRQLGEDEQAELVRAEARELREVGREREAGLLEALL
jgi:uncharacterized protein